MNPISAVFAGWSPSVSPVALFSDLGNRVFPRASNKA